MNQNIYGNWKVVGGIGLRPADVDAFKDFCRNASDADLIRSALSKWHKMLRLHTKDPEANISPGGNNTCALCSKYLDNQGTCRNCPVYHHTGRWFCEDTPVAEYERVFIDEDYRNDPELYASRLRYIENIIAFGEDLLAEVLGEKHDE